VWHFWVVRQADLDSLKQRRRDLMYADVLSNVANGIYMRTDKPPFNDVRVRRAISHAVDRQAIIDAVYLKGEPTPAIARGLSEWSARIDELGPGARYYRHDPKEARRLLTEAGFPRGLKTQISVTGGYGADAMDAFQLVQRQLKESGIDAALNVQEYGAYMSTTFQGKYEGMAVGPFSISWEPHSNLYGMYMPEQPRNSSHVSDPRMIAMLREEARTKDLAARRRPLAGSIAGPSGTGPAPGAAGIAVALSYVMPLSLQPRHLARYRDLVWLLFKYGRTDIVARARLEEVLSEELPPADTSAGPEAFAADLERLGPTFIKLGQLLSTRSDLLPEPYLLALSRLQDDVTSIPFTEVEPTVRTELGVRLTKAFKDFDGTPIAAASLGQVHRAVLRDGRTVAVKVRRPGVRLQVADDLEVLQAVAELIERYSETAARYEAVALVEQLRRSLLRELDYRQEAENLGILGRNLSRFARLLVPQAVPDYTTSRVLTMEYVSGTKITALSPVVLLEVDAAELADVLFAAYLQQILVDGFFHADPHPGNLLVTPDGALALLDVGMVARLTSRMQDHLLQLFMAISEGRGDDAVEQATRLGEPREDFRAGEFARSIRALVAEHREASFQNLRMGRLVLSVTRVAAGTGLRLPSELMMLGKTLLNLDEIARRLDPEFNPSAGLRRHLGPILQRRLLTGMSPSTILGGVLETKDLVERLPARLNRILDRLADEEVRIHVHGLDQAKLVTAAQKIANRITLGLLLAALIIGAAMLVQVETPFRLFGYPALAIVFFVVAAAGGLGLIVSIVFGDD
jgi:predicted unusual protein kinase regulating ubiquinone biosynthesis (AarF/ABC1/UbiB family)